MLSARYAVPVGAAENSGVIVRALDNLHSAAHGGAQADRVANDHADWILVVEQERENLSADLTRWGGDHQHEWTIILLAVGQVRPGDAMFCQREGCSLETLKR